MVGSTTGYCQYKQAGLKTLGCSRRTLRLRALVRVEGASELAGEGKLHRCRVRGHQGEQQKGQFIEVDNKEVVSVKLLDQHRAVRELAGQRCCVQGRAFWSILTEVRCCRRSMMERIRRLGVSRRSGSARACCGSVVSRRGLEMHASTKT